MRYARRTDNNQAPIVEALRAAGAKVKVIHQPFDLEVWAPNGKVLLMEIKNPKTAYGRKGLNPKQAQEAQGLPVSMVDSVEAALRAYKVLKGAV
jgi:hypothetical protein